MKKSNAAAVAAVAIFVSGCASIVEGTTQSISVTTTPVGGANCVLTSSEGTYYVTTPGNVTVHKTKNDLAVVCKHDGYVDAKTAVPSHFNGATVGNVIAGGVIGIGIDAATGANYNYPESVDVPMVAVAMPAPMQGSSNMMSPINAAPAAPAAPAPATKAAGS
jgi:hypothetical protein